MLDLDRLERIELSPIPYGQIVVALTVVGPNYALPPRVTIRIEGREKIPAGPVIFAMNHTDRYNYFPFMYRMFVDDRRYMAVWVKGKYYENPAVGFFMEKTNNIPAVSRGYLISKDFAGTVGRPPREEEYRALRDVAEMRARGEEVDEAALLEGLVPRAVLTRPRDMLGRPFDPARELWSECLNALFVQMMRRFVALNGQAFERGLDVLIYPEGTRSLRLGLGRIGLAQIALKFSRTIVPVGCNGTDRIYPGDSPIARGGRVVYRVGDPIGPQQLVPFVVEEDFDPFTPEAEVRHREKFEGLTALVMERLDGLLDPEYQAPRGEAVETVVTGHRRFL